MTSAALESHVAFVVCSYRRCSMNIWCRAHHISGTLKRNLYSLQMLVFLWLSLITKEDRGDGAGDGGVSSLTLQHMATITVWGATTPVFQTSLHPCCLFLFSLSFLSLTPRFSPPHRLTLMLFADWFCLSFRGPFWPRGRNRNQPNIRFFFILACSFS